MNTKQDSFLQVPNVEAFAVHRGSVGMACIVFHFNMTTIPATVTCSLRVEGNHPRTWNGSSCDVEVDNKTMAFNNAVSKIGADLPSLEFSGPRLWNCAAMFASMKDQFATMDWTGAVEQSGYTLFRVL